MEVREGMREGGREMGEERMRGSERKEGGRVNGNERGRVGGTEIREREGE